MQQHNKTTQQYINSAIKKGKHTTKQTKNIQQNWKQLNTNKIHTNTIPQQK